jgi:sugar transferase (PEP-CTERM system associated)
MVRLFNCYVPRKTLTLFLLETGLLAIAVPASTALRSWQDTGSLLENLSDPFFGVQCLIFALVYQACFFLTEMYEFRLFRGKTEEVARAGQAIGCGAMCLAAVYFTFPALMPGRGVFLYSAVIALCLILFSRMAWHRSQGGSPGRALLIGHGPLASALSRELRSRNDLDIRIEGVISEGAPERSADDLTAPLLGTTTELPRIVEEYRISEIIVATDCSPECLAALATLRIGGVRVHDALSLLATVTGRIWIDFVKPDWFIFSDGFHRSRMTARIKRAADLVLGVIGLVSASPVMMLVALLVKLDSRGPCLYRQARVGLRGRHFELLKFRSMRTDAEAGGLAQWASDKDPRITRAGRYLRKFRLDELPQFLNVIRGDMSFVGPRPERPVFVEQLRQTIPYYDERHSVRPGLTGWAQVRFTYTASIEDSRRKLEYDLYYLKQMSIAFDIAIILYTVRVVLFGWEWGSETVRQTLEDEKTGSLRGVIQSTGPAA